MAALLALAWVGVEAPAQAKAPGPNGRIAFARVDKTLCGDCVSTYTVNPDGTYEIRLSQGVGDPHWSPDGTKLATFAGCSFNASCATVIVDAVTGASTVVPNLQPTLIDQFFLCNRWSPDGTRLACVANGNALGPGNVLYTIRPDGTDLTKVLACPNDGCGVWDYSPDGTRLLITRIDVNGARELFAVRLNGTGLRQITPSDTLVDTEDDDGSWSPTGRQIVFGGHTDGAHRRSIFVVNADGTGLHQVPIPGCGGAFSDPSSVACFDPAWSPDGTRIVFVFAGANRGFPSELNAQAVYTVGPDGNHLSQVTTGTNLSVLSPDWGSQPLASG